MAEEVKIPDPAQDDFDPILDEAAKKQKKKRQPKKKQPKATAPKAPPKKQAQKAKKAKQPSKKRIAELIMQFTNNYSSLVKDRINGSKATRKQYEDFLQKNDKDTFDYYNQDGNKSDDYLAESVADIVTKANYNKIIMNFIKKEATDGALQIDEKERTDKDKVDEYVRGKVENPTEEDIQLVINRNPFLGARDAFVQAELHKRKQRLPKVNSDDESKEDILVGINGKGEHIALGTREGDSLNLDKDFLGLDINNPTNVAEIERFVAMYDL